MHAVWWERRFGSAPLRGEVVCRMANMDEMLALVEAGIGIAVLPDYFVDGALRRRTIVRVDARHAAQKATNQIALAWRKNAVPTGRFIAARDILVAERSV